MDNENRYNKLNKFLKDKFGERVLKICIDGNFTCPNRDGSKGVNGCIFCSNKGSGDHMQKKYISEQVKSYFNSYRSERANKFIVYFQNFTGTYDSLSNLKSKYDAALIDDRIVGLSVATRPDCINEEVAKLLNSYTDKYYVSVELGLQTSNDILGEKTNRKYSSRDFEKAVHILNKYNIDVTTHIMIGLPGETKKDIQDTVKFLNNINIQGLKIHSTYIVKDTKLEEMYNSNLYTPITLEYYLNNLVYVITHISKNVVIHRVSGDAPKELLVAPSWNLHKKWIINGLDKILREKKLYQGIYYC